MAYVAVNKDGSEYIFEYKPNRDMEFYWQTEFRGVMQYDHIEYDTFHATGIIDIREHGIELQKGSIKKLIGRDMTWEDEPVKL